MATVSLIVKATDLQRLQLAHGLILWKVWRLLVGLLQTAAGLHTILCLRIYEVLESHNLGIEHLGRFL